MLTVNPAITYGMYERVKSLLLLAKEKAGNGVSRSMTPAQTFAVGALSKTLATIVTYPYIMAKVRIQARSADAEAAAEQHREAPRPHEQHHKDHSRHVGALDVLKRVYKREGVAGWYQVSEVSLLPAAVDSLVVGDAIANYEGGFVASLAILDQGAVRAMGTRHHPFDLKVLQMIFTPS